MVSADLLAAVVVSASDDRPSVNLPLLRHSQPTRPCDTVRRYHRADAATAAPRPRIHLNTRDPQGPLWLVGASRDGDWSSPQCGHHVVPHQGDQ